MSITFFQDAILVFNIVDDTEKHFNVFTHLKEIAETWSSRASWVEKERETNKYFVANNNLSGINTTPLKFKKIKIDLTRNYNNDLPVQKITSFLNDDTSGIILLHGEPGTGKTSYLNRDE